MLLGRRDDVVEPLEAIGARVDLRSRGRQVLVVDRPGPWLARDVVEAPDAEDLEARLADVVHDEVHIRVVRHEAYPVRVRATDILGLVVDLELEPVRAGEGGARSGLHW